MLASVAILGAIVLIRRGERSVEPRSFATVAKVKSLKQCA
jgi:hypothetical protein